MGTRFNAVIPFLDFEKGDRIFHNLQQEVTKVESLLSYFYRNSEVFKLNHRNRNINIPISEELFIVFEICFSYNLLTEGAFDITLRPIIEHIQDGLDKIGNDKKNIKSNNFGMDKIKLNKDDQSITFDNDYLKIDFGGFGKGYALEKIKAILSEYNIRDAFISFGESSVTALGKHPNGNCWNVGINNYLSPGSSICTIELNNESLSSSANFTISDSGSVNRKINVIDPVTKVPASRNKSITVKSSSPVEAEILSTAFLILQKESIEKLIGKINRISAVEVIYNDEPQINIYSGAIKN